MPSDLLRPAAPHRRGGTRTMDTIILGDGALGRAMRRRRARRRGDRTVRRRRAAGRPGGTTRRLWPAPTSSSMRRAADAVAANLTAALGAGCRPVRHRDDRLARRPRRASRHCCSSQRRRRGRRVQLQPRGRALRPARRGGRRAVRPARDVRPVPRRVAPPLEARPAVRAPPATSPGGSSPAIRAWRRRRPRGRSSGRARRPGCTSSASMPPARRSSSA